MASHQYTNFNEILIIEIRLSYIDQFLNLPIRLCIEMRPTDLTAGSSQTERILRKPHTVNKKKQCYDNERFADTPNPQWFDR